LTRKWNLFLVKRGTLKKGTNVPFQSAEVRWVGWDRRRVVTKYTNVKVGEPDASYFLKNISKDWQKNCRDVNLGLRIAPNMVTVTLSQNSSVDISLYYPPHNDETVTVEWSTETKLKDYPCQDCIDWEPKKLTFTAQNFALPQKMHFNFKNAGQQAIFAVGHGGGYNTVPPVYSIFAKATR